MRREVQAVAQGALASITAHRARINDLNVYPVPDGDTGTNLTLTVRSLVETLDNEGTDDRVALAKEVSRAVLMGARGNSGVILSQIIRGATESLAESDDLARAFRSASDAAYRAVKRPVEGTMLTAIREMADAAERTPELAAIIDAGDESVVRTREMLPVLREAGVVDAGAAGLVEIVRGIAAALAGKELPQAPELSREEAGLDAIHQELSRYRYCTVFVLEGERLDAPALEAQLEQLGDSLLVVGDDSILKVHVHTDDPGAALSLGVARGAIAGVEIANMHVQTAEREERLLHSAHTHPTVKGTAVVAVVAGAGNRLLFEDYGATVVDGGSTMNPSTADLVAAVEQTNAAEVVVLPNNGNVIMSAEQAADHSGRTVRVVPTLTMQAGLVALATAFDPSLSAHDNAAAMGGALATVATGAVTIASRDVKLNGVSVREGAWLGLAEGEPVAVGETFDEVAGAVVETLLVEPRGMLTLLSGAGSPPLDALVAGLGISHPDLELDVHEGGQPHYALLLAAE